MFEYVQYVESHKYTIVEEICPIFPGHITFYVIKDEALNKYNAYGLQRDDKGASPSNARMIVKVQKPFSLNDARRFFPEYHFTEANYGF